MQTSAFPDLAPEVPVGSSEPRVNPAVPRTPGWTLVADTGGPKGFHRVKSVGTFNSVRTLCGLTGRAISETERMIVPCAACEAVTPA